MTMPFDEVFAAITLLLVSCVVLSSYLGWRRGWAFGFHVGIALDLNEADRERQTALNSVLEIPYTLAWYYGWDYGFRAGDQARTA